MSIFLSNFVQVAQGPRVKSIPPFFNEVIVLTPEGSGYEVVHLLQADRGLGRSRAALLLVLFWFVVTKTAARGAHNAPCEQDSERWAALLGIDRRPHHIDHLRDRPQHSPRSRAPCISCITGVRELRRRLTCLA